MSFDVSLNFLFVAVLITEFEAVFLHKFLSVITKAESVAIDIDGSGLSFHLVESPRIGRYPRPLCWLPRFWKGRLTKKTKRKFGSLWKRVFIVAPCFASVRPYFSSQ